MWNLSPLEVADYAEHIDIAFFDEALTDEERELLLEYYNKYRIALGRPNKVLQGESVDANFRARVLAAYSLVQEKRALSGLRAELKLLAEVCPYCGFAPASHLDHLLQKAHFKLFSIFPLNLIPSCEPCNTGKRRLPSSDPQLDQLHTYLEDVSHFDFFRANANIDEETGGLTLVFYIEHCVGMSDELYGRLVHHLDEFKLQPKYKKQVNILLGEIGFAFVSSFKREGAEGVRQELLAAAEGYSIRFGLNDWRRATVLALAECTEFCDGGFKIAMGATKPA